MDGSEEFDEFVRAEWSRLRAAAMALTGGREDAEDLLQEVLSRTYARWHRVRRDDPVRYVRRALVNAYIDSWRKHRRAPTFTSIAAVRHGRQDADRLSDREELRQWLADLSGRERAMVVHRHYFGLSEAEVAEAMGCSLGTVKSTTSRALRKLRTRSTQEA